MKLNDRFLKETTDSYDMDLYEVRRIADRVKSFEEFYEELEDFIKLRCRNETGVDYASKIERGES
jgi:hypothetical protein